MRVRAAAIIHEYIEQAADSIVDQTDLERPDSVSEAMAILKDMGVSTKQVVYDYRTRAMLAKATIDEIERETVRLTMDNGESTTRGKTQAAMDEEDI